MQIFKAYFKVLNKKKGSLIMYLCIFASILYAFILPNLGSEKTNNYSQTVVKFAVVDKDNSEESKALVKYISDNQKKVTLKKYDDETIQDELYNRNIDCCVFIKDGFTESIEKGNTKDYLEIVTIPGTYKSTLFENNINSFVSYAKAYMMGGMSTSEAFSKAAKTTEVKTSVTLPDGSTNSGYSKNFYFFNYLAWIFVAMSIVGICPVLIVFTKEELKKRIEISSYKFFNYNKELFLAVLVTGLGICLLLLIFGFATLGSGLFSVDGLLLIINMIVYMMMALSLSFLVGKFVTTDQMLSLVANLISLGMSFLCGVFVPAEYLGDGVLKIAKFLPAYWYVNAVTLIDKYGTSRLTEVITSTGIVALFAVAFIAIAMVFSRRKAAVA